MHKEIPEVLAATGLPRRRGIRCLSIDLVRSCVLLLLSTGVLVADTSAKSKPRVETVAAVGVELTFLGNEGVLLSSGEDQVLVDALFGDGLRGYAVVPQPTRDQLEKAQGIYGDVDLVLATHHHGDHFDAAAVATHLRHNEQAHFLSTPQSVQKLKEYAARDVMASRVHTVYPKEGASLRHVQGGVRLKALNLHHGRGRQPPIQNLGFIVEMGGLRLLHVGDTEVNAADIAPYALQRENIDVLLAPAWFFTSSHWQEVLEIIGARYRIVMHLAEADAPASWFGDDGNREGRLRAIRERYPEAIIMDPLESRSFMPIGTATEN